MQKGKYLDKKELSELGLNIRIIDESAYDMLEKYCVLQKMRRGEEITEIDLKDLKERS